MDHTFNRIWLTAATLAMSAIGGPQQPPDAVLADFEGTDYVAWTTTGEAFGSGPAQGTLPNQMPVSGYQGHGLANSYYHGDGATGTLTSPEFIVDRRYLNFLLGGGSHPGECCINLLAGGKVVRTATGRNSEHLDWRTWDVADLRNKPARVELIDRHTGGWGHINVDQITLSERRFAEEVKSAPVYQETWRPQFHFTAQKGWLNDPNGLVYYAGEYHMFFQHNPSGTEWGNMTWGHAVSRDLVRWKQLPNALIPDRLGTMFSGSAVVDWKNTSGFQTGKDPPLVAIYTAAGGTSPESKGQPFTQCIAYSNDRGRTWTKYAGNPVLPNVVGENRDPKVVWHAPTRRWVMALYLDKNDFALFNSPDLKNWTMLQRLTVPGCSECPDFFEMAVMEEANEPATRRTTTIPVSKSEIRNPKSKISKWVFTAANGKYLVGDFDGARFTPEPGGPQQVEYGANCYAVQTYSDLKDGRRIQVAWMQGGTYPEMPFNQQMSLPCELTLRRTEQGLRLFKNPVKEIDRLRSGFEIMEIASRDSASRLVGPSLGLPGRGIDQFDLQADIEVGTAKEIQIVVKGERVVYSVPEKRFSALGRSAPLEPTNGKIRLQLLVDRTSLEVFGNGGQVALSSCFLAKRDRSEPTLTVSGGRTGPVKLVAYPFRSIWPPGEGESVVKPQ